MQPLGLDDVESEPLQPLVYMPAETLLSRSPVRLGYPLGTSMKAMLA
jgi:hypothetical protein